MLVVWDGKERGDGPGGTADAVKFWRAQGKGHTVDVIDVHHPVETGASTNAVPWKDRVKRGAFAASGAGLSGALLLAMAWNTDLVLDARQVTRAEEISQHVREQESFDASHSAGLFVGVRDFSRDRISPVPYAVDDAVDLAYLFAMELKLIEPKNVVLALSGAPQKRSSRKRLSKLLASEAVQKPATHTDVIAEMGSVSARAGEDGILVASVATHGFSDRGLDYLVASDSVRSSVVDTGIRVSKLFHDISGAKAPRKLLLLDACREPISEGMRNLDPRSATPESAMSAGLADAIRSASGMAVLSGTTQGGFSYDDPDARNGVFTDAIIEGLGGEAPAVNGFITVTSLATYVQGRVYSWVEHHRPEHLDVSQGISYQIEGEAATMPLARRRDGDSRARH